VQSNDSTTGATLGHFSDANPGAPASDFAVFIDWDDGSGTDTTSGQVVSLSGGGFKVTANHTYTTPGTYTITTTVSDDGGQTTSFTSTATIAGPWSIIGSQSGQRTDDPDKALLLPVSEATVDLNQGGLRLSHALDFDQSPGSDVGGTPALVYNSVTADAQPVIQLAVQGDANAGAPSQAVVQLIWDNVAQTPVTYSLFQPAGALYQFAVQPDSPVAASGVYNWSATVTFTLPDGSTRQAMTSGTATVVSRAGSAYGAGWGIDGISQLVATAGGVLLVTGQGDSRFFASNGSGFTSPAEDFGTLKQNSDGSYTYTAKDQTQLNYNRAGYQTSVVDTHGLATTYQYDGQNRLIQVNTIDGGVTTLTYDGTTGLLDTITEPGGRVLTLAHDGNGNLTQITDVDNTTRTFGYTTPSNHLITSDQWDPLFTSFSYMNGLLSGVSPGGNAYNVVPAASVGLGTMMQMGNQGAAWASLTDGDGHMTQYLLDPRGRLLEQIEGDGTSSTTYQRNAAGLVTQTVDPMGRTTLDSYNSAGDLLQETAPDGSWTQYQYDPTFHQVTETLNSLGEQTSNSYDPATGDLRSSTDATGATTTYTYYQTNGKSNGLVYQVTTPAETGTATTTNVYDAARRLSIRYDALNTPTYYAYDSAGNPSSTTDVYNHVTQTVYNGRNELVQSMDALGAVTTDTYNAYGEQTSETNARGFTATTSYDGRGLVTARTDDLGVTVETDGYDGAGNLTRQTDANGNATQFQYEADNRQVQTTYADGSTSSETYDPDNEVVSSTDQLGRTTTNVYNLVGEEIASTDPMGRTNYTVYDAAGNVIQTIDPMGWSTLTKYDADNRAIQTSRQVAAGVFETDTTVYDKAGEVVETIDPLGHKTFDNFNADGEETGTTDANGKTTSDVFDLVGNLIQSTDADGKITKYSYDADNRQIAVLDPDGNLMQTVYDAVGNVIQTTDPKGTTTTSYDADNRVVATKDADGNVTQQFYDANGNTIKSIDANGKVTQNWFDAINRDVRTVDADGNLTATVYNAVGNVTTTTDGAGNPTQYGYDADNEQTSVRDGNGHVTQFGFNADGQETSETDADGNTTKYVLDGVGNVVATVDPLGKVTSSQYDQNNQLVSTTDALGRKITEQYDNDGRLLQETWYNADGSVQDTKTYTYDNNGNLLTATSGVGTYTMTYDNNGNLLTRTDPFGKTLTYGYDGNNNVTSVRDSDGGTLTNVFDSANRLISKQFSNGTTQARLDIAYTPDGQVATLSRYKDTAGTQLAGKSLFTYDPANNVTRIQHQDGSGNVLGDYQYAYDTANRLSSETDTQNGGAAVTTNYAYDKASQLTQAGSTSYPYDSNGNRNSTGYLTGPGNRMLSDGTWNYTYDAVGNTISKTNIATGETWAFSWDNANHLTQAVNKDAQGNLIQTVTFKYDVFGQKVEEDEYTQATGQTTVTKYAYDMDGNIWADLNASNQVVTRRLFVDVNGLMQPFARIDASGNVAWYLTDHLGSVRLLTDNTGAVIDQIDYDAYGNITKETNPTAGDRYKWASGQWQTNVGMYQFGMRWFMPSNGHWLSEDPTGLGPDTNPYRDVGNEPTNAIDPTGQEGEGLEMRTTGKSYTGDWGKFYVPIKWSAGQDPPMGHYGAIVQHVRITFHVWGPAGDPIPEDKLKSVRDYWELWWVDDTGQALSPEVTLDKRQKLLVGADMLPEGANIQARFDDVYGWNGMPSTSGIMTIAGLAYYFPDVGKKGGESMMDFRRIFINQGAKEAGGLPSFYTQGNGSKIAQLFRTKMEGWTTHVAVATWGWKGKQLPSDLYVLETVP
jgi:RHS repeat-associated protein